MVIKDYICKFFSFTNLLREKPVTSWGGGVAYLSLPAGRYHLEWKMEFVSIPEDVSTTDTKKGISLYAPSVGFIGGIVYDPTEYGKTYSFSGDLTMPTDGYVYTYTCFGNSGVYGSAKFHDVLLKNLDTNEILLKSLKTYLIRNPIDGKTMEVK